ncbi:MAG TPA: flagellar hook-associated protein FlgL [Bacillota bacterium]|nr:flagellar hook-associated protein FlgL [Bacillota bacterium]
MRVTNSMIINNLMRNLNKNLNRLEKTQRNLSSGKKFVNPSDDPIGVSRSLRLNTEVAAMDQYKRNADDALSWLSTTEMAAKNINEVLKRAKELTVQAASETNSINERLSIAEEIKELRNQLIHIGNTTYAGSYLFSGFKTDKPLLTTDGRYDLGGGTNKLTFDELIEINIGVGDRIGENFVGQRIFGLYSPGDDLNITTAESLKQQQIITGSYLDLDNNPITAATSFDITYAGPPAVTETINLVNVPYNDIAVLQSEINNAILASADLNGHVSVSVANNKIVFEADGEFSIQSGADIGINENEKSVSKVTTGDKSQLIAIFDQLIADLEADDTEGIGSALTRIDNQFYNVNAIIAEIGVKMNRVELTSNRILDDTLNLKDLLSKNEDADIAEVVMNLKMQEYVYQASLSGGAKIIQPSLVDFLR